jgi:hypothetical protein
MLANVVPEALPNMRFSGGAAKDRESWRVKSSSLPLAS